MPAFLQSFIEAEQERSRRIEQLRKEIRELDVYKRQREQGVDEETIQKLREYEWNDFNAERRFREHQTSLLAVSYTHLIQKYANQYGLPEYVSVIQAILMQESGGRGTDPMQSRECPYNTRYSNSPNAIQDADYSIQVGIQYYACLLYTSRCV